MLPESFFRYLPAISGTSIIRFDDAQLTVKALFSERRGILNGIGDFWDQAHRDLPPLIGPG